MITSSLSGTCPFCNREVGNDLVLYGGKCPYCFGEIPGEETPTDPGEDKKRAEHESHELALKQRRKVPVALLVAGGLLLTGIVAYFAWPSTPQQPVNLDDAIFDLGDITEIVAYQEPKVIESDVLPVATDLPANTKGTVKASKTPVSSMTVDREDKSSTPTEVKTGEAMEPGKLREIEAPTAQKRGGPGAVGDAGIAIQRRDHQGIVLSDDDAIVDMVKRVVSAELPKLRSCYDQQLKKKEDLAGTWELRFTIDTGGHVKKPSVVGTTTRDRELETCIESRLEKWPFQPIKDPLPITKSVTFRPH